MNSSGRAPRIPERPRMWRRRLGEWTLALVFVYVVLVAALLFLENRLVFLATAAADDWSPPKNLIVEDVDLQSADGTSLHGWWCPRPGGRGAVLFCHGQGGNLSHRGWLGPGLPKLNAP